MRMYRISITVPESKVGTVTSLLLPEGKDYNCVEVAEGKATRLPRQAPKQPRNGSSQDNVRKDLSSLAKGAELNGDQWKALCVKHGLSESSASPTRTLFVRMGVVEKIAGGGVKVIAR